MKTLTEAQYQEVLNAKHPKRVLKSFFEVKKLPYNNWYKNTQDGDTAIIYFTDEKKGYGISFSIWEYLDGWIGLNNTDEVEKWKPATDKEVEEMLIKEAEKRFGIDWEYCKITKHSKFNNWNDGTYLTVFYIADNEIWNKNGCIFKDGIWAEKL